MVGLVLEEKLESLRRCLARVEARRAVSAEELAQDPDRRDIVHQFARAVISFDDT